uniref:Uncharacterized protein n=1 Tax=Romanomermis culicivorax TaxID=13658 RepID=A0A915IVB6_ROMCU
MPGNDYSVTRYLICHSVSREWCFVKKGKASEKLLGFLLPIVADCHRLSPTLANTIHTLIDLYVCSTLPLVIGCFSDPRSRKKEIRQTPAAPQLDFGTSCELLT